MEKIKNNLYFNQDEVDLLANILNIYYVAYCEYSLDYDLLCLKLLNIARGSFYPNSLFKLKDSKLILHFTDQARIELTREEEIIFKNIMLSSSNHEEHYLIKTSQAEEALIQKILLLIQEN